MTNEELATKIKAGQRELIPQLWGQIERLCTLHADRVSRALPSTAVCDFDDLYQSGYFAMLKAIEYFDPDGEYKFTTYFTNCLKNAMADASGFRTLKQKKDPTCFAKSLDAPISDDDETTLGDITADSRDPIKVLTTRCTTKLQGKLSALFSVCSRKMSVKLLKDTFSPVNAIRKL